VQFEKDPCPATVETDVVIVGSGCGGAVCAKILAEAGHRVLVVDKGYYYPPTQLPMPQEQGARFLFENGGFLNSADSSINVVAGSCWGGGGSVNWSVSLQTQGYCRREWSQQHGLPFFETQEFQDCLDRVCDFMGVSDQGVRQTHRGQVLLDGSKKLGYHASPLPQNSGGREHWCKSPSFSAIRYV
jgi:choline dehydrogenase-like flavoprotein